MTYLELLERADRLLEKGEITIGEWEDMIAPLRKEIAPYGDLIYRQDALDALGEEPEVWFDEDYEIAQRNQWRMDRTAIGSVRKWRGWVPCSERLPDCEQEVLICTEKKLLGQNAYIDQIVTPAIYEDGTMPECDSKWSWVDVDFDKWDQENDCGIVPEGFWENRHFNPDEVYNNPVDRKVIAWMPLPEPYRGDNDG